MSSYFECRILYLVNAGFLNCDELAAKENFDSNLEEEWIFQTECLFNRKLANYLRKRLNYDARFKTFTFNNKILFD